MVEHRSPIEGIFILPKRELEKILQKTMEKILDVHNCNFSECLGCREEIENIRRNFRALAQHISRDNLPSFQCLDYLWQETYGDTAK
jgi:hypothetical protein